jgi:hypothetical protein
MTNGTWQQIVLSTPSDPLEIHPELAENLLIGALHPAGDLHPLNG